VSTTLTLVALLVFAFAVSRLLHRYAARLAMVSGIEYVIVGVLIGPMSPFGLVDDETFESLELLVTLLLGLLGFMVGLHARSALRRFEHFLAGSMAAFIVALVVGLGCLALIQGLDPTHFDDPDPRIAIPVFEDGERLYQFWASDGALWLSLTLGSAAAVSASTAIRSAAERWRAEGSSVELLLDLAVASQVIAILLSGLALAGDRAVTVADQHGMTLVEWALVIGAAGAVSGLLFTIFISGAVDDVRLYLATLGLVIFAAGIGSALGVSPLFVNLVAGLIVAATSAHAERLQINLEQIHRPVAILVLVFAGIAWQPVTAWLWLVPVAYLLLRLGTRLSATRWAVSTFVSGIESRRIGAGLLGQGTLAASIALAYTLQHPELGPLVMSAVLVPMLASDLFSSRALRRVLANSGAIRPRPAQVEEQGT
jgi:Kef-type K+ transport system membrane component KefB